MAYTYTQQLIDMSNHLRKHGIPVNIENNTAYLTGTPFAFETGLTITVYDKETVLHRFKQPKIALKFMKEITTHGN